MKLSKLLFVASFAVSCLCAGVVSGAELQLPELVRPGELFVANLVPDLETDKLIRVKIDTTQLQFMGALQGTPDIQIINDVTFEIKPESGTLAAKYELKFIPLLSSGSAALTYSDSRGEHNVTVVLTPLSASRGYSWLILGAGLLLLVVGIKLWRYQKSAPAMMSTKSLFMNYEELEKARKMYFPEDSSDAAKASQQPASAQSAEKAAPAADKTPAEPARSGSGSSTSKQKAVQPVNIGARLAQYGEDEKPVIKAAKPLPTAAPTASAAEKTVTASPSLPAGDSTLPVTPAAPGESTVPVMHTAPANESTVPVTPAVPVQPEVDAGKTRPSQKSAKAPAAEPPKPKVGMAPIVADIRKDTGQAKIRLPMLFAIEDEKGRTYEAQAEIIKIGRRKDCQIALTASEISREHVEIFLDGGKMMVKPLTTSNICRLNGNELKKPTPIKPGDKLNMGGTEFMVTKSRPA
ncbi:MAG: hypothetical protein A2W80_00900 [Candidatus Riflebacteria bacterium GWC2_50_8]|nr:MAG: hypothetical protein A2W80_00900 [Candidatus Riflebacteria bacterium GWC2_50_8]